MASPIGCGSDHPANRTTSADASDTTSGDGGMGGMGGQDHEDHSPSESPRFMLGADISGVQEEVDQGATYFDTDGVEKPILEILRHHGFNYVRLRTFVDPMAQFGYAYGDGETCLKTESYCDLAHTLEVAKQVKEAEMGFLLDFHYSDNWADPGKQIIPAAWRDAGSVEELADLLKTYTKDSIQTLVEGGARPDVVQIGNEITPGLLVHVPTERTDCWGNNSAKNDISGAIANWNNLALLLRAGVEGVEEVDPTIKIMMHLENTDDLAGAERWVETAQALDVRFDILGLSCYPAYQGEPSVWKNTFNALASRFTDLSFVVAEFGPEPRAVLEMLDELPDGRGVGAFVWEPTRSGSWGMSMFAPSGASYQAKEAQFGLYDELVDELDL